MIDVVVMVMMVIESHSDTKSESFIRISISINHIRQQEKLRQQTTQYCKLRYILLYVNQKNHV